MRLPRISLSGFRDPVRRPRFVVWSAFAVLLLIGFAIFAMGATSTRWFCANPICHKVQGDTIDAYQASSHANISCMACHEPVNAAPNTFLFAKVKSLREIIPTVTNTYSLPLNAGSALALNAEEMTTGHCTQCHSMGRKVTASKGIIIDHQTHADLGISCTSCHNRIAHNDTTATPALVDPAGNHNVRHPDFMRMDYCFRCHDLEGKVKMTTKGAKSAPGACPTCHPKDFELVPETHDAGDWRRAGHAEAAKEAFKEVGAGEAEAKKLEEEGVPPYLAAPVNTCFTCHVESKFCEPCHGSLVIPKKK